MTSNRNTIIESIGMYLPPNTVSSRETVRGCKANIRFPLQRMTGIEFRHVTEDKEFAIDLAEKAVIDCLARSAFCAEDIELVICSNTCRYDHRDFQVSFEPSTSVRLKEILGLRHALAFDIASACSGMFVAINIVDAFIKVGAIRNGMVVSGEYLSHIARTAQLEIDRSLDPRLACLTLGDAGAALTLREGPSDDVGFHTIELDTLGRYSNHCIAKPTDEAHGGFIMVTDVMQLSNVAVRYGAQHALRVLERFGWALDSFQQLIMHQTSSTTLRSAMKEINRLEEKTICHKGNTINNLANRGNTASTTHFVAVMDSIANGTIRSGDRVVFAVSGSGQTIGTALYTFDNLPDRIRDPGLAGEEIAGVDADIGPLPPAPRIRIAAWGTTKAIDGPPSDSLKLLKSAVTDCLERSTYDRNDIELLIYTGVYRTDFVAEPAVASMLAGELDINASGHSPGGKTTLAFDVLNGGVGFLNACYVAAPMMRANGAKCVLIATADIENNAKNFPEHLLGLCETGGALIVEEAPPEGAGFGRFLFRSFTDQLDTFTAHCTNRGGKAFLTVAESSDIEDRYISAIVETVEELLSIEDLQLTQIDRIFPPQRSSSFVLALAEALDVPHEICVDAVQCEGDLLTSSIPFAWQVAYDSNHIKEGDLGLIISVGSGIQVGCALYHF